MKNEENPEKEPENIQELDMLSLYAYCDSSQAEMRAAWRGFISFIISKIVGVDANQSEELIVEAIVDSPEKIYSEDISSVSRIIQEISQTLSGFLGLSIEFGLAAFLDYNPPTKNYSTKRNVPTQDEIVTLWMQRLGQLGEEQLFQSLWENWRKALNYELAQNNELEDVYDPEEDQSESA